MKTMSDFEVCPVGTAKRLAELEKMLAARPEPVRCKDLNVGDRVRMMTDWTGVVTGTVLPPKRRPEWRTERRPEWRTRRCTRRRPASLGHRQ